ncbi:DUF4931 domain-containing protein [Brachyspira sp. SAP_772]|uniref:galactose-1-phosphate uridylyltransferase n=1 Tax=Brachyspira sp. SAP_772 TaxID=2608385 RepID=UPI0012F49B6A|nr:DUF4931 domain-containing protein [Brachyspira sp. SAP_772]
MPHIRKDPITKQSVIIASERMGRPSDYINTEEKHSILTSEATCPFCKGNEDKTPEHSTIIFDDNKNWIVRIVPNKYPIIAQSSPNELPDKNNFFEADICKGFHDVIIENPNHNFNYYNATEKDLFFIFEAIIMRFQELSKEKDMLYSLLFKNFGREAGASLIHSHAQMMTTPFIPIQIMEEIYGSLEYYNENKKCVYCSMIEEEKKINERVICENNDFIAISPFASKSPYQIYILPKKHSDSIVYSEDCISQFASIVKDVFNRINKVLGEISFNYVLHTLTPALEKKYSHSSHWFLDIMPKMSKLAGYELGSGVFINSITPEDATNDLKNAL